MFPLEILTFANYCNIQVLVSAKKFLHLSTNICIDSVKMTSGGSAPVDSIETENNDTN